MSSRTLLGITMGTAGAILLGYCIYLDQKRRGDPEYKRKLHDRRQHTEKAQDMKDDHTDDNQLTECPMEEPLGEVSDTLALEHCFESEMKMGEQLICQGNIADGVTHFANAIMMCAHPLPVLQTIQESLPDFVFMPLLMKLTELQSNSSSTKDNSTTSIQEYA
ncbi:mitochondrial import receptor subunit TOM20 homolog B-like [Drosophila sulfurigaster albostrigata]|uniref:mitochondrial import receptor subunit TOM20 homolog B-like n=1 Tax=Drosophila sulfurigaster albostrigata TaxID=89887 RepID=UPI002D21C23A|nr:mitochondrial import receptor subunit TOM20 homolog B-like [Drosophila sulfurigaster albostrigata]